MTFNSQRGNKWGFVGSNLLKDADVLALQEVNTPPVGFVSDELDWLSNTKDTSTTSSGLPSLKYEVHYGGFASSKSSRNIAGKLIYVSILDKTRWGLGGCGDDEDPDTLPPGRRRADQRHLVLRHPCRVYPPRFDTEPARGGTHDRDQ
ncbi:hypothetical protein [Streptomyces sp. 8L]|uniref:hypothetical protein n=1 Tax=Streptomyces sp. 8L TaxID=2877242 RepID=UPI001CD43957|nr:hypothetical protein [Streptomyces sp. 8L]MCA1224203.1 hypothetical protein [Streptomyces sp. 8L]